MPKNTNKTGGKTNMCMSSCIDFPTALTTVQNPGVRIGRYSWNNRNIFIVYQKAYPEGIPCNKNTAEAWKMNEGELFKCEPYLQIQTANGSHAMWTPNTEDLFARDWYALV